MMCRPARSDVNLTSAMTVVAVAAVVVAVARPVLHAAVTVLQVLLVTAAVAAGLAAMAAVAFFVMRVHRSQARALATLPVSRALAARQPAAAMPAPQPLAIEAPRQSAADVLGLNKLDEDDKIARDLVPPVVTAQP
jgi:hypothetical protein